MHATTSLIKFHLRMGRKSTIMTFPAAVLKTSKADRLDMDRPKIIPAWSHGARHRKRDGQWSIIRNLWVVAAENAQEEPDPEPKEGTTYGTEEMYRGTEETLTILTIDGAPCPRQDMERYRRGLPTGVQRTTLKWPMLDIPPWMLNQKDRNMVWNFMAWRHTDKPWMDLGHYWAQRKAAEATHPDYNPDFPFYLVTGVAENGNDTADASISEDEEDQQQKEEQGLQEPPTIDFLWEDHKAVKDTRAKYREKRRILKSLGRTGKQALQLYYDQKEQKAKEEGKDPASVVRLPGHEWTIRPPAEDMAERPTPATSSTSPP